MKISGRILAILAVVTLSSCTAADLIHETWTTQYLDGPDGLSGNDDCGQMSAWYIFSALGFYPVNPYGGEYVIGAPQLPEMTIRLPEGKTFTMSAWYMFCQMGFYPLCVGTENYELFTPLFSKVTFHLPGGTTRIVNRCQGKRTTRVIVDGQSLDGRTISHQRLFGARRVVFE